ncbi:MAG: hypothetical protein D6788_04500, partial [Planctomycetota bacterium]
MGKTRAIRETKTASSPEEPTLRITRSILNNVERIAREAKANAVFLYADAIPPSEAARLDDVDVRTVYITKTPEQDEAHTERGHQIVRVPNVSLNRAGQMRVAILLALSRKIITPKDVIVFLTGSAAGGVA